MRPDIEAAARANLIQRLNDIADGWEDMGLALLARDFGDKAKAIVQNASPFNTIREAADRIAALEARVKVLEAALEKGNHKHLNCSICDAFVGAARAALKKPQP